MIRKLHHNAYRCRDSEETRAFYEDFLGLPMVGALEISESKTGRATEVLHTFYRLDDGSHLAFFEATDMPFDFKPQHDFDLHIALEVDAPALPDMLAKGKASGIETRGVSNHGFVDSIYFRDPNGYVIELCAKRAGHDEQMDPAHNGARQKLQRWTAAKANSKLTSNGHATHPSPEMIMKIGMGFWASKVLLTATRFELFTHLAEKGWLSAAQIMQVLRLKCTERNALDFLDTLTHFGFLERKGVLAGAVYGNGKDTAFFLDKNKPSYLGGILEMADDRLYGFWGDLKTAMGTGQQQNEAKCGIDFFGTLYSDPEKLKGFVNAMAGIQMGAFMAFAQQFDFSRSKSLVDIGGSGGHLSLMVAKHQPHMRCTSFDLPAVQPIAKGNIAHFQLTERVTTAAGDFFADTFPKADVITMGNILHDWDEEKKISLMRKAHDALPEGGAFVAIESVIDNDRRENVFGMMMSLNMLVETSDGFDYTFADFEAWAKAAGFSRTALMPLAGPTSAAIAYK